MRVAWSRLIRFVATDGRTLYGEPILTNPDFDIGDTTEKSGLQAKVVKGQDVYDTTGATKVTDEVVTVKKLLVREAGRTQPPFPSIFFKPSTTVADHGATVVIPKIAQDEQADYEGELVVVIGRDAKDVSESEALDYVAAYTAGNDISSRKWQRDPAKAGGVPQWGFSKGFDTYAPLGPVLVSSTLIPDPSTLHLKTIVDGELRQNAELDDLVFSVSRLIAHLSSGTTLQKGSVIMTGTPGGVGAGLKPPKYLVPGTSMEVNISTIGTLRNGVDFA